MADDPRTRTPGSRTPKWPRVAARAAILLAIGAFLGYLVANTASMGGLSGVLGRFYLSLAIAVIIGVPVVVGLIASAFRRWRRVGSTALAVAGLLFVGVLSGFALTPILGLDYREPVTLQARGTGSARLDGVAAFTPLDPGPATCRSVQDGDTVIEVTGLDLGDLGAGTLRGSVSLPEAGATQAWVELWVVSADEEAGAQPEWFGNGEVTELGERGTSGRASFRELPMGPESGSSLGASAEAWPSTLSGEMRWTCGSWFDPSEFDGQEIAGRLSLELDGVSWTMPSEGAIATCGFGPEGTISGVAVSGVGRLQDMPVDISVDMLSSGGRALLDLRLSGRDPTPHLPYIPNWESRVDTDDVSYDGRTGSISFEDVPTGASDPAPPLPGWPETISGSVQWQCGS